jgi:hypothetical protein
LEKFRRTGQIQAEAPNRRLVPVHWFVLVVQIHLDVFNSEPETNEANNVYSAIIDGQIACVDFDIWAPVDYLKQ